MSDIFLKMVNMSISASWLVLAVLLLRLVLKKAPKWVNVLLWGFVAVRLILPVSFESALSLIPSTETVSPQIMTDATPEIFTGIEVIDDVVNPVVSGSFTPAPLASANPLQIWIPVAACVWLAGVAVMLLYTAVSYFLLRRKVATAVRLRDNIYQSENVASPFVLGLLKPRIYLPFQMENENMPYVIAHEQAHIRRKDHWWKPLGFLLLSLHWFNPLLWVGYILLCRDIELACDEKVIREMDNEAKADYTQALVSCSINRRSIAACPLAFGEVGVKERVKSVLHYKKPAFWIVLTAVVLCIAVAVCFLTDPPVSVDDRLAVFLDCRIAEHFQNEKTKDNASCVNYEVLGKSKKGDTVTLYLWVLYEEYSLVNNQLHVETAVHIPTVITAERCSSHGEYDLIEYWEPRDGAYLKGDIRGKFPWYLQHKALDSQRYIHRQQEENEKMAWQYLLEQRENDPLTVTSGKNSVPLIRVSAPEDCASHVYWLTIAPDSNSFAPFDIYRDGQEQIGFYNVYDAQTMEPLPFGTPSGLAPQTWLFQNADPERKYIVTVELSGLLYAFGAQFDPDTTGWKEGVGKPTMDELISEAILSRNGGDAYVDVPTGAICVESHYTLDSVTASGTPTRGDTVPKEITTVYLQYVYKRYYYSGGTLEDRAGTATVAAISLTGNEETGYAVTDFWEPNPGSTMEDEIWAKFSKAAAERVTDPMYRSWYANDLESECLTKAERYVAEISGEKVLPVSWVHDVTNDTATCFRFEFDVPCLNTTVSCDNAYLIDMSSPTLKEIDKKLEIRGYHSVFWAPNSKEDCPPETHLDFTLHNGEEILYEGSITICGRELSEDCYAYTAALDCPGLIMESDPDNAGAIIRVFNGTGEKYSAYEIHENEDYTQTYKIFDKKGNVLYTQEHFPRRAEIGKVSDDVYSFTSQAGTGISTRWAVYCDVENSKVSDTFGYVLMAKGDYVIYGEYKNKEHSVVVQNIFDKSAYYKKYTLENCAPVAAVVIVGAEAKQGKSIAVTYLTGTEYAETELLIELP